MRKPLSYSKDQQGHTSGSTHDGFDQSLIPAECRLCVAYEQYHGATSLPVSLTILMVTAVSTVCGRPGCRRVTQREGALRDDEGSQRKTIARRARI